MKTVSSCVQQAFIKLNCSLRRAAKQIEESHCVNLYNAIRYGKISAKLALKLERHLGLSALELYIMQAKEKLEKQRKKKYTALEIITATKNITETDEHEQAE